MHTNKRQHALAALPLESILDTATGLDDKAPLPGYTRTEEYSPYNRTIDNHRLLTRSGELALSQRMTDVLSRASHTLSISLYAIDQLVDLHLDAAGKGTKAAVPFLGDYGQFDEALVLARVERVHQEIGFAREIESRDGYFSASAQELRGWVLEEFIRLDLTHDAVIMLRDAVASDPIQHESRDTAGVFELALEESSALLKEWKRYADRLALHNLRLARHVAKKYRYQGLNQEDLLQEAHSGLIRAVQKYDWRNGTRFSTYATQWIEQAIQRAIANKSRVIRLPVPVDKQARKLKKAERELMIRGQETHLEDIAQAAGVPVDDAEVIRIAENISSIDAPVLDGDRCVVDGVASDSATPEEEAQAISLKTQVEALLGTLDEEARLVLMLRFGIGEHEALSVEKLAKLIGQTPNMIRRIERKALEQLRSGMSQEDFLD